MSIRTAGELRGFLADTLEGIRAGSVDVEEAKAIAQVADQITKSLAVEVSTALQLQRMGKDSPIAGSMLIASGEGRAVIVPPEEGAWCEQCEKRVTAPQSASCADRFCKAKKAA